MPLRTPQEEIGYLLNELRKTKEWGAARAKAFSDLSKQTDSVRGLLGLLKHKLILELREHAAARLADLASRIDTDGYWVRE